MSIIVRFLSLFFFIFVGFAQSSRDNSIGRLPSRQFCLWGPGAMSILQGAVFQRGRIYYLRNDRSERTYIVGAVNEDGSQWLQFRLPESQYYFLGIRPTGGILVQRLDGPLEELGQDGKRIRTWVTEGAVLEQILSGDELVRVLRNGRIEGNSLSASGARRDCEAPGWLHDEPVAMERTESGTVFLLGKQQGRVMVLPAGARKGEELLLPGVEIGDARSTVAVRSGEAAKAGKPVRLVTVAASGTNGEGELLILVAPYRPERAVIVAYDKNGRALRRIAVRLPDRKSIGFGIPARIGELGSEVCLAFIQGGVACYPASAWE